MNRKSVHIPRSDDRSRLRTILGTAVISEKEAEKLRRVIERRRIRLLAEAAVDGAEVDTAGMNIEDVLASLRDLVGETDNPDLIKLVDGVAATFGDDAVAGRMKPGGLRARRSGNVVVAPGNGEDQGFGAVNDGENFKAVWLDDGEYIFSNKAIEGLGLQRVVVTVIYDEALGKTFWESAKAFDVVSLFAKSIEELSPEYTVFGYLFRNFKEAPQIIFNISTWGFPRIR